MESIGQITSRLRGAIKAHRSDSFITNRELFSVFYKHAKFFIRRQDNLNKLVKYNSIYQTLPCVEMIDVDKVEACCLGIQSDCYIKRSKDPIPRVLEGAYGTLFRTVSSIDMGIQMQQTDPITYTALANTTTFKYNKTKYFWYMNGYVYSPNIEWDAVRIEALFEDILIDNLECVNKLTQIFPIPGYLLSEIERQVIPELQSRFNIPVDPVEDKFNPIRE